MLDDKETYSTDGVECPYCGLLYKDSGDCELYTEDEIELECSECEKDFLAYGNNSWSWTGKRIPCEGEHNFGKFGEWIERTKFGEGRFRVRYCQECGESDYEDKLPNQS